jgi:hypothetical protein
LRRDRLISASMVSRWRPRHRRCARQLGARRSSPSSSARRRSSARRGALAELGLEDRAQGEPATFRPVAARLGTHDPGSAGTVAAAAAGSLGRDARARGADLVERQRRGDALGDARPGSGRADLDGKPIIRRVPGRG